MSFEKLLKKISPALKRITRRLNGRFSYLNEQDLYQEALIRLWLAFRAGELDGKTDSYILQGCYFHLKNYIRKHRERVSLVSLESCLNSEEESFDLGEVLAFSEDNSCRSSLHYKMLAETILDNGLSKREKEVFALSLKGLTTREIGQKLGVSHVRVVKLIGNIREKSRKYLD